MRNVLITAAVLISILTLHIWSLMRFPSPFVDEAWLASRAWGYIQTGRASGPLDVGLFDYIDGYWTFLPLFPTWLQSLSLRLFQTPNLVSVRIVSLLFGFILLGAIYWIGQILGGRKLAFLCLIMVSLSYPFFYSAHLARYDIIAAAIGYIAIAIYLADRQSRRIWAGYIIGILLTLAIEVHPNSIIFLSGTMCLYLWDLRKSIVKNMQVLGFLAGGVTGLLIFAVIHVLPDPVSFLRFNTSAFYSTHTPPILSGNILILLSSIYEMNKFMAVILLFMFPVTVIAYLSLLFNRTPEALTLILLVTSLMISYVLLIEQKIGYYAIYVSPILLIMAAKYLLTVNSSQWTGSFSNYIGKLAWGLFLVSILFNLAQLRNNTYPLYLAEQNALKKYIKDGDVIMGPQVYWFGFFSHDYLFMEQIGYYRKFFPGKSLEEVIRHFSPSVLIADNHLEGFMGRDTIDRLDVPGYLSVPETEFKHIVNTYGQPVNMYESSLYGSTRIYRFDW